MEDILRYSFFSRDAAALLFGMLAVSWSTAVTSVT
jgi:hypothetical protein